MARLHAALVSVPIALAVLGTGVAASSGAGPAPGTDCAGVADQRAAWVSCMLGRMTLRERIGQMFAINGFGQVVAAKGPQSVAANRALYGPDVSNLEDLIDKYHPGEVIYFDWSNTLENPSQIAALSRGVQRVALDQRVPVPMLISTDQEQGEVLRIGDPATVFPGNMALGATRSTRLARRNAAITGQELRAMGINVDNAPVVDVNVNPKNNADGIRSFGDRVDFVSRYATAQIEGYQGPGQVGAVAKHWPGLGDTTSNPDTGVTVSNQTLAQLEQVNFPPFEAAIRAGVGQIMVTTVQLPKIVPSGVPADLSPRFVDGLLRGQLGYQGPVITDALNAQALSDFKPAQVALRAIRAGDDQLLEIAGPDLKPAANLVPAYRAVLRAVKDGRITQARIDQSVRRILGLKWDLGLATNPSAQTGHTRRRVGTPEHLAVARRTAARSITLLRNHGGLLPLRADTKTRALVTGWGETSTPLLANEIESRGMPTQSLWTGQNPSKREIRQTARVASKFDLIVVDTFNVWAPQSHGQIGLVRALIRTGKPVVVVAIGTPYDIAYFRRATAFLAAYDYQPVSLNAAVAAMFGHVKPRGRLPVTIRRAKSPHRVIYPFGFGLGY